MALSPKSMHLFMKSKIFLRLDLKVDPFTDLNKRVRVSSRFQNKQNKNRNSPKKVIMFLLHCFHRGSVWYFCQECNRGQYG